MIQYLLPHHQIVSEYRKKGFEDVYPNIRIEKIYFYIYQI